MQRFLPALALAIAIAPIALAQDPAAAVSDLAKTPISIFGAWGLSLSILIAWLVKEIRAGTGKDAIITALQTALSNKDTALIQAMEKWNGQADTRTQAVTQAVVAGNLINDKLADSNTELKTSVDGLSNLVRERLPPRGA